MSDEGATTDRIEVPVDGTQLALIMGSTSMLACGSYQSAEPKDLVELLAISRNTSVLLRSPSRNQMLGHSNGIWPFGLGGARP